MRSTSTPLHCFRIRSIPLRVVRRSQSSSRNRMGIRQSWSATIDSPRHNSLHRGWCFIPSKAPHAGGPDRARSYALVLVRRAVIEASEGRDTPSLLRRTPPHIAMRPDVHGVFPGPLTVGITEARSTLPRPGLQCSGRWRQRGCRIRCAIGRRRRRIKFLIRQPAPASRTDSNAPIPASVLPARVAKLVDAPGLGPDASNGVRVRVPPRAPETLLEERANYHAG